MLKRIRSGKTLPLLIFYLSAVFVRLLVMKSLSAFPNFTCPSPGMDADFYYFLSEMFRVDSPVLYEDVYFYSPLFGYYIHFLSGLFGDNTFAPVIINILVGSSVPVAVYLIAKELVERRWTAYLAGGLAVFYDSFVFYSSYPLKSTLAITLIAWGLYCLMSRTRGRLVMSGVLFGLAAFLQGGVLLFAVFMTGYLLVRREFSSALYFILPIIILLSLSAGRNYAVSERFVLITDIDGIHFYMGNNRGATGVYREIEDIRPNAFGHYFDARKKVSETLVKQGKADMSASKYFKKKAWEFIGNNPVEFLKLSFKKLLIANNKYDVPNNENLSYMKSKSNALKYLTVPFIILGPLGIAGFFVLAGRIGSDERSRTLFIFTIASTISVVLFFITDRYRLPLAVPYLVYAGVLADFALKNVKSGFVSIIITIAAFFAVSMNLPLNQNRFQKAAEAKMKSSAELCAIKSGLSADAESKKKSEYYMQLAGVYLKNGAWEQARYYYYKAFKADPENEEAELSVYKLGIMGVKGVIDEE